MHRYVIGDIHGCLNELRCLIEDLPLERGDCLIYLGDYIDRGPDSEGVVSYLLELQKNSPGFEFIFLKGNHEDMLLSFLGLPGQYGDMFLYNGGRATLASYGLSSTKPTAKEALSAIPSAHLDFYQRLRNYYAMDYLLCVHAGIQPLKRLEDQTDLDLFWIRREFIDNAHTLPYTILFGHTPQRDVFFDLPYKVGLDTGLVYGNKLSCLETTEKILFQISRGATTVKRISLREKWVLSAPHPVP
jgi:serine/threonine protein phosphatase 1